MEAVMLSDLSKVGLLPRREIEGRVAGPLIKAFFEEFGEERVRPVVEKVVSALGEQAGADLAKRSTGGNGVEDFAREYIFRGSRPLGEDPEPGTLPHSEHPLQEASRPGCSVRSERGERYFSEGDAIEFLLYERSPDRLSLDVVRCLFADMYRELGLPELGYLLSCGRDFALIKGFNPEMELKRTKTLMEGGCCCDFRIEMKKP
jgi:fumarate reductase iron-sulfur subunit